MGLAWCSGVQIMGCFDSVTFFWHTLNKAIWIFLNRLSEFFNRQFVEMLTAGHHDNAYIACNVFFSQNKLNAKGQVKGQTL